VSTPPRPTDTLVVAVAARSRFERARIAAWAAAEHPGAPVVPHDRVDALRRALSGAGDPQVVPVRVTWRPGRAGSGPGWRSSLPVPQRPPGPFQRALATRSFVAAGAPGRRSALRARFELEAGRHGPEGFARFVARQAWIACDRAEREVLGGRFKVPRQVVEQITGSARFTDRVVRLAGELGRPPDEVEADARRHLEGIAAVQSPLGIGLYQAFMRPMHSRAWTVQADDEGFRRLTDLNRRHALVFLPTHRSYVDPLVLNRALAEHDLPPTHILGGANMAWWPLGPLGRRAGVVFIRRSFGGDRVYKLAVREYLRLLVAKRFNLEWYIEGGRTRTGKLRPPKLGLLRYLTEAVEDDDADVMLVPVSIVYDRLREAGAMTAEQTGGRKRGEGLWWWLGYVRSQQQHAGVVRVHVGDPFLLRGALEEAGSGPSRLDKVAFRICDAINDVTPVTAASLVTLALLGARGGALTIAQIEALSAPLLDYVERRDLRGPVAELRTRAGVLGGLESLVDAGVLTRYDGGTEPVWSVADGGHHVAAFYRNGALHHVVGRAIAEVALLRAAEAGDAGPSAVGDGPGHAGHAGRGSSGARVPGRGSAEVLEREALAVRDLLKFEFFFAAKERFLEQVREERRLMTDEDLPPAAQLDAVPTILANRVLRSFVDAQLVVAERLAERDPRTAVDPEAFLRECLDVGRQMLLQRRILQPEAVGRELFTAAMRLAENRDLVDPGREEVRAQRREWLDEVRALLRDLDVLRTMDEARQAAALGR
jgi:glycerol-3-phosphate O-acyltransferase